jgi:hypothetical protein
VGRDIANLAETRIYNPRTRSWRMGPELPIPLSWGLPAWLNGRLYVTGERPSGRRMTGPGSTMTGLLCLIDRERGFLSQGANRV